MVVSDVPKKIGESMHVQTPDHTSPSPVNESTKVCATFQLPKAMTVVTAVVLIPQQRKTIPNLHHYHDSD